MMHGEADHPSPVNVDLPLDLVKSEQDHRDI